MNIFHSYETTQNDFLEDQSRIKFPKTWKSLSHHSKLQKLVYFALPWSKAYLAQMHFQNELFKKKKKSFLQGTIHYEHKDIYFTVLVLFWSQGIVSRLLYSTTYIRSLNRSCAAELTKIFQTESEIKVPTHSICTKHTWNALHMQLKRLVELYYFYICIYSTTKMEF